MSKPQTVSKLPLAWDVVLLPASVRVVSQEAIDALEAKRARRLRELGDWRPSSGWHIEPQLPAGA